MPTREWTNSVPAAYARSVMSLVQAWHSIIDHLIQMATTTYLHCPTVTTVRALYAIKSIFALQTSFNNNHTTYGGMLDDELLAFEQYLDQLEEFLMRVKVVADHKVAKMALTTVYKIRAQIESSQTQGSSSAVLPLHNRSRHSSITTSENELEDGTTPTLQKMDGRDQDTQQPRNLQQSLLDPNVMGGAQDAGPPLYTDLRQGFPSWADSGPGSWPIDLPEFDLMTMPAVMPFAGASFWNSTGAATQPTFSHGWSTTAE